MVPVLPNTTEKEVLLNTTEKEIMSDLEGGKRATELASSPSPIQVSFDTISLF
jgi:hypothetical protein